MSNAWSRLQKDPMAGLINSALLATLLTAIGHMWLGFEQSLLQWAVALAAGYSSALFLEYVDAKSMGRPVRYIGKGKAGYARFLLSAHMTATTMSFLIYVNDRLWAMAFAVVIAISSKYIFRVKMNGRYNHFFNPSNFGIAMIFILLPWSNTIPYHFTENYGNGIDWLVFVVLFALGTRLNLMFTKRIPLIASWLIMFVLQAVIRDQFFTVQLEAELFMMTGPAFVLFTFYMITDPMTSPSKLVPQIAFGSSVAIVYGLLMVFHIVFALFFAVTIVCAVRGTYLYVMSVKENFAMNKLSANASEGSLQAAPSR